MGRRQSGILKQCMIWAGSKFSPRLLAQTFKIHLPWPPVSMWHLHSFLLLHGHRNCRNESTMSRHGLPSETLWTLELFPAAPLKHLQEWIYHNPTWQQGFGGPLRSHQRGEDVWRNCHPKFRLDQNLWSPSVHAPNPALTVEIDPNDAEDKTELGPVRMDIRQRHTFAK